MTSPQQRKDFWAGVRAMPVLLSIAGGLITGATSTAVAAYGFRDAERERVAAAIRTTAIELRTENQQELRHYVTRQEMLETFERKFDRFENRLVARIRAR